MCMVHVTNSEWLDEIGAGAKIEQAILGPGTVVPPKFDLSAASPMRTLCLRVEGGVACLTKDHLF